MLPDLPSRSGCPVIGARATRVPPRWRELPGRLGAEDTGEERVVPRAPAIEVAGEAVGDLHAKPCGHRRPAHRTEGAPPCDGSGEPHAALRARGLHLEPDFLLWLERRQRAHVKAAPADVVRKTAFVFLPACRAQRDGRSTNLAR